MRKKMCRLVLFESRQLHRAQNCRHESLTGVPLSRCRSLPANQSYKELWVYGRVFGVSLVDSWNDAVGCSLAVFVPRHTVFFCTKDIVCALSMNEEADNEYGVYPDPKTKKMTKY